MPAFQNPAHDCTLCPRLCAFHAQNRVEFPTYHNGPVPAFGGLDATLLVIGLAPGLHGANASGRPFTGDFAGDVLYGALMRHGFARGTYGARRDDDLTLVGARITNAVRCVPPQNKPTPDEIKNCRDFLIRECAAMPNVQVILTLGQIAHDTTLRTLLAPTGGRAQDYKFAHGAVHTIRTPIFQSGCVDVVNTYHTSRYNVNTGRLTTAMVDNVFEIIKERLAPLPAQKRTGSDRARP